MLLSTDWPDQVGRRVLAKIDSTNAEAARVAHGLTGPEWILALKQTAGRARRGRGWSDPPGNFAATYVMRTNEPADQLALRSFVSSLALYDACVAASGRAAGLALKWPNDVLLNGGKLAGILLESSGVGSKMAYLAIGIGVNLVAAPDPEAIEPGATPPVSLLSETGAQVTPEEFLDLLAPAFAKWEQRFTTYGFAPVREVWLSRAARLGEVITARTGTEKITGIFETIDTGGKLVLSTPEGKRAIPAADIFF